MIRTLGPLRVKESEVGKWLKRQCSGVGGQDQIQGGENRNGKEKLDLSKSAEMYCIDLENDLDVASEGAGVSIQREERSHAVNR